MTPEEKSEKIAKRLSTKAGREELGRKMMDPLSYGFHAPYAVEFLCECDRVVKPVGFGSCPECGFDLMLSEPVPFMVVVILVECD